jgi:hypothetical protein
MCKKMPVILVNRVVDPKRIIGKMEGRGGEAQGVPDPPPTHTKKIGGYTMPLYYKLLLN